MNDPHSSSGVKQGANPAGAPIALSCSFTTQKPGLLGISGSLHNASPSDIYLLNRLWTLDASSRVVPDPERFYRFVRGTELRILWGAAPLPRLHSVTYRNIPHATLVKAGATFDFHESIKLPTTEYSVYFAAPTEPDTALTPVTSVVLVIQYIDAGPAVRASPLPDDATAMRFESAAVLEHVRLVQCSNPLSGVEARKRRDQFDRLTLPGEAPEPLALP